METAYATALWKMVAAGMDPRKAVAALREKLVQDGREALLPRIARAFERIAERESKKNDIVLSIAKESDERKAKTAAKEVLAEMNVEAATIKTHIDESLIGGWRLEGKGILIDTSYKKQLLDLYHRVTTI